MKFLSREWCEAVAAAMLRDREVIDAIAEFGPVVAGVVIDRVCVLARIRPGEPVALSFPEDEDELEEYEPDYIAWAPHQLCVSLLQQARPDPLKAILEGKVRIQGDLERLLRHAGRHRGAGLDALRSVPTEFV